MIADFGDAKFVICSVACYRAGTQLIFGNRR
jgi:hypothetical protein